MSDLKWYRYAQNNSGGSFVTNEDVGEDVYIQARSKSEAEDKFYSLDNGSDDWCECCGERWYSPDEQDEPNLYGKPLSKSYSPYSSSSHAVLHYLDGRKEFIKAF